MARKQNDATVKARLTRERIVDCALALADAEGLDAVTIRRLAQDQGVTPMALYWHFKDKDLLLNGIAERLVSEVVAGPGFAGQHLAGEPAVPVDGADGWADELRDLLSALLVVLRAHPAVADLVRNRFMLSEPGLDLTERALTLFRRGGFTPEQSAQLAGQALTSIVLLVTNEPGRLVGEDAAEREQRLRTKKATIQALPPDRYPSLLASADGFVDCGSVPAYFDLGLDLFVEGVRALAPTK